MSTANCDYPVIGRFLAAGIFLADDCGIPIDGADAGWIEHCAAALSMEDDVTEADGFVRTCANGTEIVNLPGAKTFAGINVNLDLHGVDPAFAAKVGGQTAVSQDGTVVGWDDCADGSGSASLVLWREIVGAGACDPASAAGSQYLVTIIPWVDQIRIVSEGTFGGDDGYMRITGRARSGHGFGKGPVPLFPDTTDPTQNPPVCMDTPIGATCLRRSIITPIGPPSDCGAVAVTACT